MEGNAPPKKLSISELDDVRLIVKSANQQFDDLIVHTEPSWNIRKLKTHLSQVYPSNPTVPEQKLIYSGQLLSDDLILKDILRSYKDVETENHIFHLVYTPKISATKPKILESQTLSGKHPTKTQEATLHKSGNPVISSTEGLRHRNIASTSASATASSQNRENLSNQQSNVNYSYSIPQVATTTAECPNNYPQATPFSFPPGSNFNTGANLDQQTAMQNWVQQVYQSYMEQCLKMANLTMNAAQMQANAPSIPMFMPMPQFMPPNFPNLQTTTPPGVFDGPGTSQSARATFAPRVLPVIPPTVQSQATATAQAAAQAPAAAAAAAAPADNIERAQPRFPNIVQEEQDNRDWLDSFYSVTRLVALLTLVFFYSSPLRCLVVAIIAVGIYLYHIGFFQNRRQRQANNRNINNNQNIDDNNAPAAVAGEAAQAQDAPPAAATVRTEDNQSSAGESEHLISSAGPPEAETTSTSLIAFVRTFVVSFFASLLPETPAL